MALRALAIVVIVGCGLSPSSSTGTSNPVLAGRAPAQGSSNSQNSLKPNSRPARWVQLAAQNASGMTGLASLNTSGKSSSATDVFVGLSELFCQHAFWQLLFAGRCCLHTKQA